MRNNSPMCILIFEDNKSVYAVFKKYKLGGEGYFSITICYEKTSPRGACERIIMYVILYAKKEKKVYVQNKKTLVKSLNRYDGEILCQHYYRIFRNTGQNGQILMPSDNSRMTVRNVG